MLTLSKCWRASRTSKRVWFGSATLRFGVVYWFCPLTASEKLLFSLTIAPPTLNPKPLSCSGPFVVGERALRAHRSVAERQVRGSANRPDARLCDDVDERGSRLLGLGGELIARHVDGFDLRLRRELLPFEAVDSNDGVRAGNVGDLLRHFRRVVRQRLDLFLRGRQSECLARAIGASRLRVPRDGERFRQVLDLQHHDVLVVAGPDPDVGKGSGFKPWELSTDAVAPRREAFERHHPLGRGLGGRDDRRLGGVLEAGDRDRCLRDDGRTRVDDRDDQVSARRRRLRASGGGERQKRQQHRQSDLRPSMHVPSSLCRLQKTRLPLRP